MLPAPPDSSSLAPLFVLEGIDGSGKGTQAALLHQALIEAGVDSVLFGFPRYQETFFGGRVGDFLNGKFGSLDELPPFLVSLLYAGDRFESFELLKSARQQHQIVVLDRYVDSNVAHQGAKVSPDEQQRLVEWIEHVEYEIYQLPRPERVILLDLPVEVSQQLIRRKQARTYTEQTTDLQESDTDYLQKVRETYLALAQNRPAWQVISLVESGELRTIAEIHAQVLQSALKLLKS